MSLSAVCLEIGSDAYARLLRAILLVGSLLCSSAGSALALNPQTHISQYGHAVWRVQEGYLEGYPTAFAQTPDGYLWVGTSAGLYRFDASWRSSRPSGCSISFASANFGRSSVPGWKGVSMNAPASRETFTTRFYRPFRPVNMWPIRR